MIINNNKIREPAFYRLIKQLPGPPDGQDLSRIRSRLILHYLCLFLTIERVDLIKIISSGVDA